MTYYEYLINGVEFCEEQARRFASDINLRAFWTRAADDYQARAMRITVSEAEVLIPSSRPGQPDSSCLIVGKKETQREHF